ncbi:major capsid family protein [Myxosarcina sp. GI1(2024)]
MTIRYDATDITNAGNFLSRELEQRLPQVYSRKYAKLWAEEGTYLPARPGLEDGATTVVEEIMEGVGQAKEYSPGSDNVPMVSTSIAEANFNIHKFTLGYSYSIDELAAAAKAGRNINLMKAAKVDQGLRQAVHQMLIFGTAKRNSYGLFNNPNVPVVDSSFDADAGGTSFQDHIDFVSLHLESAETRNNFTESIAWIMVPNKLKYIWASKFNSNGTQSVMSAIMESFGVQSGGNLRGIIPIQETHSALLEQFGVKAAGTNDDRLVFIPNNADVVERLMDAPDYLPPQLSGFEYKVFASLRSSETIIHYPDAMTYVDIPKVSA